MSRNAESRFATNPTSLDMPRSKFGRHQSIKTTFNAGDIIPFYVDEVLPGDTSQIDTSKVIRLQTLLNPIMDNMYLDTYYFFVPNRLVWDHWKEFMGENTQSAWIPETEYSVPQLTAPTGGWTKGTIADQMGIPTGVEGISVNALPFRAYGLIMNEWFRDQNLTDPINLYTGDATVTGTNGTNYIDDVVKGGMPFKASKYHDYFTSALPAPQKGPAVTINLGEIDGAVYGNGLALGLTDGTNYGVLGASADYDVGLRKTIGDSVSSTALTSGRITLNSGAKLGVPTKEQLAAQGLDDSVTGLTTNISGANLITINELRQAFQVQKFYEKLARGGSRYIEILKSMFGVTSPDARLQRPEYLGGNRIPISVNQVVQTSGTDVTPQGNTAAYSLTTDVHSDFTHSFVEHGFVIGLCVVRYDHTYQQGIERMWSRTSKFDYYWPLFANLGEQAIKNKEIFAQGNSVKDSSGNIIDDKVFGYQEAWADYRYKPSRVSGEMRSQYAQSLDTWHLGDDYDALPGLSDSWIREDKNTVNRVIAVSDSLADQFLADIYVKNYTTRCMPLYSIPGLIDHH